MPCYTPLRGYHRKTSANYPNGGFTTRPSEGFHDRHLTIPCGQCIGCRLERSRQWAIRCMHEAQLHQECSFITLTYDDNNLPFGYSLELQDFQKFMKRLRKSQGPLRFYMCGEYGETTHRPHYHALIFGWRPNDPELFSKSGEHNLYESPTLTKIWGLGHATFGELTFETAAYVSRYCTKKITGDKAEEHYRWVDHETGEIHQRTPEFSTMSRRPGIGLPWLEKFGRETYDHDSIVMNGQLMRPPRSYDKQFEQIDPQTWQAVRRKRALARPDYSFTEKSAFNPEPVRKKGNRQQRTQRHDQAAIKIHASKAKTRDLK